MIILQAIYLFFLCLVLALLEVQIEGKNGWAGVLPVWRPSPDRWYARFYAKLMGGKPLTGYHLCIFSFLLLILHFPFFFGLSWSLSKELQIFSFFFLISATWDFLWFVVNPHYGWKKFKALYIWWHKKWLGPWPFDYYLAVIFSFLLYLLSSSNYSQSIAQWLSIFFIFIVLSFFTVLIRKVFWKN